MNNPGMGNPFGVAPPQQQAPMGMGTNMGAPNPFAPQMMTQPQQPAMTSPFGQMNNQMANMNLTSNPFAQPTLAQAQPPMVSIILQRYHITDGSYYILGIKPFC